MNNILQMMTKRFNNLIKFFNNLSRNGKILFIIVILLLAYIGFGFVKGTTITDEGINIDLDLDPFEFTEDNSTDISTDSPEIFITVLEHPTDDLPWLVAGTGAIAPSEYIITWKCSVVDYDNDLIYFRVYRARSDTLISVLMHSGGDINNTVPLYIPPDSYQNFTLIQGDNWDCLAEGDNFVYNIIVFTKDLAGNEVTTEYQITETTYGYV